MRSGRTSGYEIELICHVTHLTFLSLPYGLHGRSLTKRQREVLELIADGKTVQDVAVLLKKSPATIEKHLRLARKRTECRNDSSGDFENFNSKSVFYV